MVKNLLPIGRFSQVCRLTVKTLRYYDEIGLLRPARVDPESGYRYYSLAQAAEAERIRLLRSLDMPLEEVREILSERDAVAVRQRLERHRRRIEEQVAAHQRVLASLQRLLNSEEGTAMPYEIGVRQNEARPIISLRMHTSVAALGQTFGRTIGELFAYLGRIGVRPSGPPLAIYHDQEFKEEDIDLEICVPTERRVSGDGQLNGSELPAGKVAFTLHAGPFEEVGSAYQAMVSWIKEHGHEIAGPPRESYLVDPSQASSPSELRTEIEWPIR